MTGPDRPHRTILPLVEERITMDTLPVAGKTVTVRTTPVEETRSIAEEVTRETVTVKRVPIGKVIEVQPAVREEGDLVIVPVVEERLVVTKQLVLAEEIHLRRSRRVTTESRDVTFRRTSVEIEENEGGE